MGYVSRSIPKYSEILSEYSIQPATHTITSPKSTIIHITFYNFIHNDVMQGCQDHDKINTSQNSPEARNLSKKGIEISWTWLVLGVICSVFCFFKFILIWLIICFSSRNKYHIFEIVVSKSLFVEIHNNLKFLFWNLGLTFNENEYQY